MTKVISEIKLSDQLYNYFLKIRFLIDKKVIFVLKKTKSNKF